MTITKFRATGVLPVVGLVLAGCASGPTLSETSVTRSAPKAGMTRIVVYRTGILGAAIQPVVSVDGRETGKCTPNGVFFVDVPKGQHQISATTEVQRQTVIDTSNVSTAYVRCSIGIGLIVGQANFEVVPGNQGASEAADLSFTGSY